MENNSVAEYRSPAVVVISPILTLADVAGYHRKDSWRPGYALDEATPDHSTISRTRRLYWLETHKAVFRWVLKILTAEGLINGRTISIDATTLEANAALKSIVRRDNGQSYNEYLKELGKAAGMENPMREQLARLDRKRKKKGSNQEWKSPATRMRGSPG